MFDSEGAVLLVVNTGVAQVTGPPDTPVDPVAN